MRWLILLLACSVAWAEPSRVTIELHEVRLVDLVRLVYTEINPRSFILSPEILDAKEVVTVSLRKENLGAVDRELKRVVGALGYGVSEVSGVVRVGRLDAVTVEKEVFVYRPRHRSVTYLQDLLGSVFPSGSFSGQRGIAPAMGTGQAQYGQVPGQSYQSQQLQQNQLNSGVRSNSSIAKQQGFETPTNAYGMINKTEQDVLVFHGAERDRLRLVDLLAQLDTGSPELLVKAVVYEVRKVETEGSALNLALSLLKGKLAINVDAGVLTPNSIKIKVGDFDAVFSALSSDKRFKLVSAPVIRMRSGTNARFTAGSDVPVLGNVTVSNGSSQQSIEYKTSGVILDLTANAHEDGTDLKIGQQISGFIPTTTGVNQSPTLLKRELQTSVTTKADEVVFLGGLDEIQDSGDDTGLSFLPAFMRSSGSSKQNTEIVVLLNVQRL